MVFEGSGDGGCVTSIGRDVAVGSVRYACLCEDGEK